MNLDFSGLLEPQIFHCLKLIDSLYLNGFADDLSDTGTGKTYCAAWVAKQMNCPIVVICPLSVITTWERTFALFGIKNAIIINYEKLTRGNTEYLSYDLRKFHATPAWWKSEGVDIKFRKDSLIIIDEQHKCRGQTSLASDMAIALKNFGYKILGCSATAATDTTNMKAFGYKANLHYGQNYHEWNIENGARFRGAALDWDGDQTIAREGMSKLHHEMFTINKSAARMRRAEFGNLFPENQVSADIFDLGAGNTAKLERVYEQMEYELAMLDERAENYSAHVFAIMMKARRNSEILKIPTMVDWIEDMFDEGISPVCFVNFTDTVTALAKRLNTKKFKNKIGFLIGGQSKKERDLNIDSFQADILRAFIVNMQAGNMGISLHDLHGKHPRNSLINPSWSAINFAQAVGRIHRANGKTPCRQQFLYANVPIEIRMANRLTNRLANLDCLNNGEVSYEYVLTA